jgi:hypothetical protein
MSLPAMIRSLFRYAELHFEFRLTTQIYGQTFQTNAAPPIGRANHDARQEETHQ